MNRLFSILLIPLFVLGQALPHSHAGSGMVEQDDHAGRPHVHLSSGHSHDQGHQDGDEHGHDHQDDKASDDSPRTGVLSVPVNHDSDAIYVGQSNITLGRASAVSQLNFANICTFVEVFTDRPDRRSLLGSNQMPDRSAGLPIYLLVASLRL
ncbi:hypothetical protein [Neorhodopirellula pilleata]|uniref:Uncharacterized protein n=1 Tax=Neorhodopirellula pilleata TaxID=2714738 RepID=A0A5C6AB62_9BACT|nr:hypothetical protein [Neorhodopirellula pilleata]TWT97254.1 hypothetical protein Pla100_24040 [Neorhodopirellula pilleata]